MKKSITDDFAARRASMERMKKIVAKRAEDDDTRRKQIMALCQTRDGEIEFDADAVISEGDDNGAYVQAWVWIDFDGTPLDKTK